jgi:hypothetical protein
MSFLISLCLVGIQEKIVLHEKPSHDNRSVSFWVCSLPNFELTLQIFFKFFRWYCQYIRFLYFLSYIMIWLFDLLVLVLHKHKDTTDSVTIYLLVSSSCLFRILIWSEEPVFSRAHVR